MFRLFSRFTGWKIISVVCILTLTLSACQAASIPSDSNPTDGAKLSVLQATITPVQSIEPTDPLESPTEVNDVPVNQAQTAIPSGIVDSQPTPRPTLGPDDWQQFPVIPTEISVRAREIYQRGLAKGNDPAHFSKLGDCQNITTYFLAMYDHPELYTLGEQNSELQDTIDYFAGSWSRESKSVKGGFNVASVFNPIFSDREICEKNESPLDCELRLYKPSIVLISMEEWWNGDVPKYETYLRRIVDKVIEHGAIPVLATKADNLEGNHDINRAIANLAYEYELPLWNFWLAVQPIPAHGLQKDGFHLTNGINDFSSSAQLKRGWVQRNLTALQVLDVVRKGLENP